MLCQKKPRPYLLSCNFSFSCASVSLAFARGFAHSSSKSRSFDGLMWVGHEVNTVDLVRCISVHMDCAELSFGAKVRPCIQLRTAAGMAIYLFWKRNLESVHLTTKSFPFNGTWLFCRVFSDIFGRAFNWRET